MSSYEGPPLKSMNPFSNNRPKLTASERIRNKRDKTIYQAEKQRFQNHKTCGNKNVRYYDNGTVRSMQSYKLQKSLARGNVLCEDCDDKGMLCGKITSKDALGTIYMGNNVVSEYWGGGLIIGGVGSGESFPVINADVSGVWDPSAASPTDPSKSLLTGFGYQDNYIAIPRNLDGSGIVIDPSNILFPDELCDPFRYLQKSYLKTFLVIRGAVDISGAGGAIPGTGSFPASCNDPSYNKVVGKKFILGFGAGAASEELVAGQIRSLCCIREMNMLISGTSSTVGIFDMYVEVFYLSNMPYLSKLVNYTPQYYPGPHPPGIPVGNSGWDWFSAIGCTIGFGCPFEFFLFLDPNAAPVVTTYNFIESFKIIQGTVPPWLNQTKYNNTLQNYMSCLEDGTRKINFTKNTVKQNNVSIAYCAPCQPVALTIATGGTVTRLYGYTIHVFTNTSTQFEVLPGFGSTLDVDYLIVGGGGGAGAADNDGGDSAGGGGGGGQVKSASVSLSTISYTIVVGAGGVGGILFPPPLPLNIPAAQGQDSSIVTVDSAIGGFGGMQITSEGSSGGGGGGGTAGGAGTAAVHPAAGGGGGGAGGAGGNGVAGVGGDGGVGVSNNFTGSSIVYGGGGGGGGNPTGGSGGSGGGGDGASYDPASPIVSAFGVAGTQNTGGGGGGSATDLPGVSGNAALGGSGIVIIRYPTQYTC